MYGESSVRNADELDIPIAERWRLASTKHERPGLPAVTTMLLEDNYTDAVLSMPAETHMLKYIALLAVFFGGLAIPLYGFLDSVGERIFFYGFFGLYASAPRR